MENDPAQAPPPSDSHLLTAILRRSLSLESLSAAHNLSAPDLLAWAARPDIAPQLASIAAIRAQARLDTALDTLADIASASPDPTERRRAASAILFASYARPRRSPRSPSPDPAISPSPDPAPPPSRHHLITSSPHPPDPYSPFFNPYLHPQTSLDSEPDDSPPSPDPRTRDELFAPGPFAVPTPVGLPLPHPDLTPGQVIDTALAALQNPQSPLPEAGLLTLHNFSTDAVRRGRRSVYRTRLRLLEHLGGAFFHTHAQRDRLITESGHARQLVTLTGRDSRPRAYLFSLGRQNSGPLKDCWLLADIAPQAGAAAHNAAAQHLAPTQRTITHPPRSPPSSSPPCS